MEQRTVIEQRLLRRNDPPSTTSWRTFYEMALVLHGDEPVAVRDHTVMLPPPDESHDRSAAIVHLSHNLVLPSWRRSGIAAWMRALPAASAREACAQCQHPRSVILAAEMEPMEPANEARSIRLSAYEAAGFRKVDPSVVTFWQPDFRSSEEIASSFLQPIPLHLVLRLCERETSAEIEGRELQTIVEALYSMYSLELEARNVAFARQKTILPSASARIALVPPTAA